MAITENNYIQDRFFKELVKGSVAEFFLLTGYKFYGKIVGFDSYSILVRITNSYGEPQEEKTCLLLKSAIASVQVLYVPKIDLEVPKKSASSPIPVAQKKDVNSVTQPSKKTVQKPVKKGSGFSDLWDVVVGLRKRTSVLESRVFGYQTRLKKPSQTEMKDGIEKIDESNDLALVSKKKKEYKSNPVSNDGTKDVVVREENKVEEPVVIESDVVNDTNSVEIQEVDGDSKELVAPVNPEESLAPNEEPSVDENKKEDVPSENDVKNNKSTVVDLMGSLNIGL